MNEQGIAVSLLTVAPIVCYFIGKKKGQGAKYAIDCAMFSISIVSILAFVGWLNF